MTELQQLLAMLDRVGISYCQEDDTTGRESIWVSLEAGTSPKLTGYSGFITTWEFDKKGNLLSIDIAE